MKITTNDIMPLPPRLVAYRRVHAIFGRTVAELSEVDALQIR